MRLDRFVFAALLFLGGTTAFCGSLPAQHKLPPKNGQDVLDAKDLSKLVETLRALLHAGETRQVLVTVRSLKPRLAIPLGDPRYSLRKTVENLSAVAEIAAKFPQKLGEQFFCELDMVKFVVKIKERLAKGELFEVTAAADVLKHRYAVPKQDPRFHLRMKIESLVIQAKVAMKFASLDLKIEGVAPGGKQIAGVMLDGVMFEEGEHIRQGLSLRRVGPNRVELSFRGAIVPKRH